VSWIQAQDFYENTTIVMVGDHLSMQADLNEQLDGSNRRVTFNVFINSALDTANNKNRLFSTMDWFPTTLASMGVVMDSDRLGLGTNLFSDTATLLELYGEYEFTREIRSRSSFYESLRF